MCVCVHVYACVQGKSTFSIVAISGDKTKQANQRAVSKSNQIGNETGTGNETGVLGMRLVYWE